MSVLTVTFFNAGPDALQMPDPGPMSTPLSKSHVLQQGEVTISPPNGHVCDYMLPVDQGLKKLLKRGFLGADSKQPNWVKIGNLLQRIKQLVQHEHRRRWRNREFHAPLFVGKK